MRGWALQDCSHALAPLLTREAEWAYYALSNKEADDDITLKEEVLAHCRLSSTRSASEFLLWAHQPGWKPQEQMDMLLHITLRWLQPDQLFPSEVVECATLDKFLGVLPGEERKAIGMKAAKTPRDAVTTTIKCDLSMLKIMRG